MSKYFFKLAAGLTMFFCGLTNQALAMDPIMPIGEVAGGMKGIARSVLDSSGDLSEFNIDVVGVVNNGQGTAAKIMVKASGEAIEKAGGVLQGMSGSPIYVDGRLIGALALGYSGIPYTFFVTPIEEMTGLWDMPDNKNKPRQKRFDLKQAAAEREKHLKEFEEKYLKDKSGAKDVPSAAPTEPTEPTESTESVEQAAEAAEPVKASDTDKAAFFFAGFDNTGLSFMKEKLAPFGLTDSYTLAGAPGKANGNMVHGATLAPGRPVGVAVAYGDFTVGATGTVTAVDGNRILAFGHPYLHQGNVNYFMTDAAVVGSMSGELGGMRIANVGSIIGRISQDRDAGIAGEVGTFPLTVPVKVHIKDATLNREANFTTSVAYDETLLPALAAGITYASISRTSDTVGENTATVDFVVRTNAVKSGKVERSNMFYTPSDVGQTAILELAQALTLICGNTEEEMDITDVNVNILMDNKRQTATLVSAVPEKLTVKPGETVNIKTTIKPYRKDQETLLIPYVVPETQVPGTLSLDLRGGGFVPLTALGLLSGAGLTVADDPAKRQTTADKLKEFVNGGKNNEIIIAPAAPEVPLSEAEQKKAVKAAIKAAQEAQAKSTANAAKSKVTLLENKKEEATPETKFSTKYIIENIIHTAINVEKK